MAGFAEGVAADPRIGQLLGEYRIKELLGRGGMGVVYLAEHERLGRNVALKLLAPALAQNDVVRERFVRESRRAAAIDHPNIIPLFEAGEVDGHLFITMRYVAGVNLRELLEAEGNTLAAERAVRLVAQVGAALDAAHAVGLIHRDVKPANVMVDRQTGGEVEHCYLTDFGLTKDISSSTGFTDTGQFVGTINYVAPEQVEGRPLDARTDIYALGCVLYESLTGQVPFPRDSDLAVMFAHVSEPPPKPSVMRPEMGAAMDAVIARALAKSQSDRHATCAELIAEARGALAGEHPPVRPSAAAVIAAAAPVAPTQPSAEPAGPVTEPSPGMAPPSAPAHAAAPPAPPVPPAWRVAGAYVPQQPPPDDGGPNYLVAAAIVAIAVLLTAGGIVAALLLTGGDTGGGNGPSESDSADARRLIRETSQLNRDLIELQRTVARQDRATARTLRRLDAERRRARQLQAEAQRDLGELRDVRDSLVASTRLAGRAANQLEKIGTGGPGELGDVTITITGAVNHTNDAVNKYKDRTEGRSAPLPPDTRVDVASLPAVSRDLPDDASVKIVPGVEGSLDSLTGVGDVNGDGRGDVVATMTSEELYSAYVVFGQPGASEVDLTQLGDNGFELKTGATSTIYDITGAGDVDNDGNADLIVPLPGGEGEVGEQWAVVFGASGSAAVDVESSGDRVARIELPSQDLIVTEGLAQPSARAVGDVNGDGDGDVAIASPRIGTSGAGATWVVTGAERGGQVDLEALGDDGFEITGGTATSGFGGSVAAAGDFNGDRVDDLAIGAPYQRDEAGGAWIVFGSRDGADVDVSALGARGVRLTGGAGTQAGGSLAGAGDMNGDGLGDLAVGAPFASPGGRDRAGVAYVVFGRRDAGSIRLTDLGDGGFRIDGQGPAKYEGSGDIFGMATALEPAGDANGDGTPDLVVSGTRLDDGDDVSFVVYGKASTSRVDLAQPGGQAVAFEPPAGARVFPSPGSDFDGDKLADIPLWMTEGTDSTSGYLIEVER